jgi:hypothetical protein
MLTKPRDILRTTMIVGHNERLVDTIEYDGGYWLVTKWSAALPGGWSRPLRIVCADRLGLHPMIRADHLQGFLLTESVPNSLFDDEIPAETRAAFQVVDQPPLEAEYLPRPQH